MKRNNPEKQRCPNLILTADWHLREDQPVCRTDDFWKAQWAKIDFINDLAEHEGCRRCLRRRQVATAQGY